MVKVLHDPISSHAEALLLCGLDRKIDFPGLFFYIYIKGLNPKNDVPITPQAPNPIN